MVLGLAALIVGCQKQDEHPPFLASCDNSNCPMLPGIVASVGGAGAPSTTSDAGAGTLTGQVLLLADDSFVSASLFSQAAKVSADGANGTPVTDTWNGADPFSLAGVAQEATNWVSVTPNLVGGDALVTYQAVQTSAVQSVNLLLISGPVLDGIFDKVSALRSSNFGQIVLSFRSAGTGLALSGLHVTMASAELAAYRSGTGWIRDDGTATTDASGLVVFGNVQAANAAGTQTVVVTHGSTPASQFAVRVVEGAATLSAVTVQL